MQPEDRMQAVLPEPGRPAIKFQSSSSPKTGCKGAVRDGVLRSLNPVSILIQPEDRMQEPGVSINLADIVFQSSSSPKTGCKS